MIVFWVNTIWGKIKQYFAICQIFKYKSGMGTKKTSSELSELVLDIVLS